MYYGRKKEKHTAIYNDYFRTELTSKEIAQKYGLTVNRIHDIIKQGQRNKNQKPPILKVKFKGRIWKAENLAKQLGIKIESLKAAIRKGSKYDKRYSIQIYKQTA